MDVYIICTQILYKGTGENTDDQKLKSIVEVNGPAHVDSKKSLISSLMVCFPEFFDMDCIWLWGFSDVYFFVLVFNQY